MAQGVKRDPINVNIVGPLNCWETDIPLYSWGRPCISIGGVRSQPVVRLSYETLIGPIPGSHDLHHQVCENQWCANPWHTVPVTRGEHTAIRHGWGTGKCKRGHDITKEENIYYRPTGGRDCFLCRKIAEDKRRSTHRG